MLWRLPTRLRIDSSLPPAELERRLRAEMAIVPSLLLSPTRGLTQPFVGTLDQGRIALRVRHGYSNGLTRIFRGRLTAAPGGSRLEGEFRTLRGVVLVLRAAWLLALAPVVLSRGALAAPALVPLALVGFLVGIELLGRSWGDADEKAMRQWLARRPAPQLDYEAASRARTSTRISLRRRNHGLKGGS